MKSAVRTSSWTIAAILTLVSLGAQAQEILFEEGFEDANLASRGWYDNTNLVITTAQHVDESNASVEFRFRAGASVPDSGNGSRVRFTPTDTVYLSYWVRYSENWTGSNLPYHPHEFYFLTTSDGQYARPAETHLTVYIEQNEGEPVVRMQDSLNVDTSRIDQDLTDVTELRGVAGCNGDSDGYGVGDCYRSGSVWRNEKSYYSGTTSFSTSPGANYQADWHFVEAFIAMNTVQGGVGQNDGVFQMWFDGELIMDHQGIVLRTGEFPNAQFNQFILGPYMSSSPVDQSFWIDEMTIATGRFEPEPPVVEEPPPVEDDVVPGSGDGTGDGSGEGSGVGSGEGSGAPDPDPADPTEPTEEPVDPGTVDPSDDETSLTSYPVAFVPNVTGELGRSTSARGRNKPLRTPMIDTFADQLTNELIRDPVNDQLDAQVACNATGARAVDWSLLFTVVAGLAARACRRKRGLTGAAEAVPAGGAERV